MTYWYCFDCLKANSDSKIKCFWCGKDRLPMKLIVICQIGKKRKAFSKEVPYHLPRHKQDYWLSKIAGKHKIIGTMRMRRNHDCRSRRRPVLQKSNFLDS